MELITDKYIEREMFFSDNLISSFPDGKFISVVVVTHLLDTGVPYIRALMKAFSLEFIIPKPNSISKLHLPFFPQNKIININKREDISLFLPRLKEIPCSNKLIILDIGGYFSPFINEINMLVGDRFIGIIEDTENGYQKYLTVENNCVPVISVARSPLKNSEDHMVGEAIVFSTDSLLRSQGLILNTKNMGVLGFGKIGKGISSSLKYKSNNICVFDNNYEKLLDAHVHGFLISKKYSLLSFSDVIFCATGNHSISKDEFQNVKCGSFIVSVTSSDDEFDTRWLKSNYTVNKIGSHIFKYSRNKHYFYLLNNGNALNFIHGAVVGDYILLIQKEMIDTLVYLYKNNNLLENRIYLGFDIIRERIAYSWINKYGEYH